MDTTGSPITIPLPDASEVASIMRSKAVLDRWHAGTSGASELATALSICLNSTSPMLLVWGTEQICFYNDACIPALGALHPQLLGSSLSSGDQLHVLGLAHQLADIGLIAHPQPPFPRSAKYVNGTWACSAISDIHGKTLAAMCIPAAATTEAAATLNSDIFSALEQSPAFFANLRGSDYVIENANQSFKQLMGRENIVKKPLAEALPEQVEQGFIQILDNVRATGQPFIGESMHTLIKRPHENEAYEAYEARLNIVYQPLHDNNGNIDAILVHGVDMTAQYQSQTRDSFLLALEDELQGLSDPQVIVETSVRLLGCHLKVSRCAYAVVSSDIKVLHILTDYVDGMNSLRADLSLEDLPEQLINSYKNNRDWFYSFKADGGNEQALPPKYRQTGIKATLSVPFYMDGELVAILGLHQTTPRDWTSAEVELVRLVQSRCWESLQRAYAKITIASREAHLVKIRDTLPQIVFIFSGDNSQITFNHRWYEYTGIDPSIDGACAWAMAHTEHGLQQLQAAWQLANSGERAYEVECELRANDGSLRWHLARAMPVHDETGQIIEWIGTYTDIHDRRDVEQKLEQSEALFRNLCETAPTMIWMTDAEGNCVYWNQRWYEFTGQNEQKALADGWVQAMHPDDAMRTQQEFKQRIDDHASFSLEYRIRRRDGQYRWCVDAASPHFDVNGQFHGHIGSIMDITERKQIEDANASERSILNLITTGTPLAVVLEEIALSVEARGERPLYCTIMLTDNETKCLRCAAAPHMPEDFYLHFDGIEINANGTPSGRAAYSGQQIISAHVVDEISYGDRQSIALAMGIAASCITPIIGSNGIVLGTLNMYYALPYAPSLHEQAMARSASYLAGIVIERNLIDAQLSQSLQSEKAARTQAEHANRVKDEFLATLSHELRTPLNAILGWSRLMQGSSFSQDNIHKGLEIIERSARSQAQLIDDLLDMSAILSGKIRLQQEHFDIAAMARSTLDLLRPGASSKHINLQIHGAEAALPFFGDAGRLQQVLTNLVSNAIKFTPAGGHVRVNLHIVESSLRLSVQDSGIGIAADFLPHVFDRFRQADAGSTRQAGGLGLGLSISRQLVDLHGGSLWVSSPGRDQGATFTVVLPSPKTIAEQGHIGVAKQQQNQPQVTRSFAKLAELQVLLVDDDEDSRSVTEQFLLQAGAHVVCAASADIAEQALQQNTFQILISDIAMPGRDGYQLIQSVRSRRDGIANIPAIALTAYVREDDREKAIIAGFDGHIGKPVEPLELFRIIRALTRMRAR
jgi:PAS domain S-box-containing protein